MTSYYLFQIASRLSRFIPHRVAYWVCSLLGTLIFFFAPSVRDAVLDNMLHVLSDASARQRRRAARHVVANVVKNYYDLVRLPHFKEADVYKLVTEIEGLENIDAALEGGRGAIVVGGHIGNFSIVAQLAALRGYQVAIVAEDIEPPKLYNFINRLRSRFGLKFIKAGSQEVRTIYKLLRSNGVLMLAMDRDVSSGGMPFSFFGTVTDLVSGPVVLALRLKTPLLVAHTWRMPNNASHIVVTPLELERTGDYQKDIQANMLKLASILEEQIRKTPEQWVVLQRVWDSDYTMAEGWQQPQVAELPPIPADIMPEADQATLA